MKRTKKAALAVSAALAAGGLVSANVVAGARENARPAPDAGVAEKDPPKDPQNKNLVKVKKTRAPSGEDDYGLAMPAGTLYDVISRKDVP